MATYIVSPTATGSGTGSLANPFTAEQALRRQAPGDTIACRGGTYPFSDSQAFRNQNRIGDPGTAAAPIIWTSHLSETPLFRRRWRIDGMSYLTLSDLSFFSPDGQSWLTATEDCDHVTIDGCTFDCNVIGDAFNGVTFRDGLFNAVKNCVFLDWFNGDAVRLLNERRFHLHQNTFATARGGHSLFSLDDCIRCVVERNWFRNSMDRAGTITENAGNVSKENVVQWNVFVDNDWDGSSSHPFDGVSSRLSERGANQTFRFASERSIFRYNLILRDNVGQDEATRAGLDISFFDGSRDAKFSRIYHNTFFDLSQHGITVTASEELGTNFGDDDLRFLNNVIANFGDFAIWLAKSQLRWRTYRVRGNLMGSSGLTRTIFVRGATSPREMTVAEAESRYPTVFGDNTAGIAQFQNSGYAGSVSASPGSFDVSDIDAAFAAYTLRSTSPGKGSAVPLATVTQSAANATTINVSDALVFSSGWGLTSRDEIYIGSDLVEVVERLGDRQIRVTPAVTVSAGDEIFPAFIADASTKDPGVPLAPFETTDPVVPPSPPPVLETDDPTPEDDEGDIIATPPSDAAIPLGQFAEVLFPNANPRLQKPSMRLNISGVSDLSPILSGLAGRISLTLNSGERLFSWRIYSPADGSDFEKDLPINDETAPTADVVFGTDTHSSAAGARNYLEIITSAGRDVRQFWVKDLPASGSLYLQNQEAQAGTAFFEIGAGEPLTFGINILPNFTDEFFRVHEFSGNRYANTLRTWGGAITAQVFLGAAFQEIYSERYIGAIHGYYWGSPPEGTFPLRVRLRAAPGSGDFVDVDGSMLILHA